MTWPDPESVVRTKKTYVTPDGEFDRVTHVLRYFGNKGANLVTWAAKEEREMVVRLAGDSYWAHHNFSYKLSPDEFSARLRALLPKDYAHKIVSEHAGDAGSEVHDAIAAGDDNPLLSEPAMKAFNHWPALRNRLGWEVVRHEQPVWLKQYGYAGTIDCVAETPDDLAIADFKTSGDIYLEHHLQLAAYLQAARRWAPIKHAFIVHLPKEKKTPKVVPLGHITRNKQISEIQLFESFLGILSAYQKLKRVL